jgi:hypothetical protein
MMIGACDCTTDIMVLYVSENSESQ